MISPILIIYDEDSGMFLPYKSNGYNSLLLPSEVNTILGDLLDFCNSYNDEEIKEINLQKERQYFDSFLSNIPKKKKQNHEGYVYILKCNNKYKIGFSKDVDRRIKQLDTRPFELKLVRKYYSTKAYDIEQAVHKQLEKYQIANEWYEVGINYIKDAIEESVRVLGCDIQY